jgi:hypothetical protein
VRGLQGGVERVHRVVEPVVDEVRAPGQTYRYNISFAQRAASSCSSRYSHRGMHGSTGVRGTLATTGQTVLASLPRRRRARRERQLEQPARPRQQRKRRRVRLYQGTSGVCMRSTDRRALTPNVVEKGAPVVALVPQGAPGVPLLHHEDLF